MNHQFSEDMWEKLAALWRKEQSLQSDNEPDYKEPGVRNLLKLMFLSRRALKAEQMREYDAHVAWQKVNRRTIQQPSRRIWRRWVKYAAVLLLLLGAGTIWMQYEGRENTELAALRSDSIQPGSQRAELILASGERILLNTETGTKEVENLGVKLVNDNRNGLLQYETTTQQEQDESAFNELNVPKGGEYSLLLPDGSRVWLNSETSLRFPVQFAKGKREVYLSGEAYFQIQKDSTAPFHVYANEQDITVLGTSFNVSAYANDDYWETTLVEGKVQIASPGGKVVMKPSEQYVMDKKAGVGKLRKVDPELYTSWVDGKFYFKAFKFEEIVKKLERWYDFTMIYDTPELRQLRFSGSINKHRPVEETLRYLEKTTDIQFTISGKCIRVAKKNVRFF